ncbi:MAG: hypothetical protein HKN87_21890 [Saprospiraceae bacterium]|nr:hypothetical protein [Saprospiraceae bacterium]
MPQIPFQKLHRYAIPTSSAPQTRGDLDKKIWIVLDSGENGKAQLSLLERILQAVGKSLSDDTCTLLYQQEPFHLSRLMAAHRPKLVLSFGVPPIDLGLNIRGKPYKQVKMQGTQFLFVDGMEKLASDQEAKKNLWAILQKLF